MSIPFAELNKINPSSVIELYELELTVGLHVPDPNVNNLDTVFGGKVMQYMDLCAAMSAYKFARTAVVTASVDRLDFLAPARVGDMLIL